MTIGRLLYRTLERRKRCTSLGRIDRSHVDESSGEGLAVFDLAWPEGLQPGFSQPVAILLNEPWEVEEAANRAGYRFFTAVEEFKEYVEKTILAEPEEVMAS